MYGYEPIGMGWGGVWMVLIWIVPILLVVLLIRHFTNDDHDVNSESVALEILDSRYARGAINQEEYQKRRADLGI